MFLDGKIQVLSDVEEEQLQLNETDETVMKTCKKYTRVGKFMEKLDVNSIIFARICADLEASLSVQLDIASLISFTSAFEISNLVKRTLTGDDLSNCEEILPFEDDESLTKCSIYAFICPFVYFTCML